SLQNYPAADRQVQELAKKIWGDTPTTQRQYGKGLVFNNVSLTEVFTTLKVAPDCAYSNKSILFTHRSTGDSEIYFLSNQSAAPVEITPTFRVKGMQPELWDAVSGLRRPLPAFAQNGDVTSVPLYFAPTGSAFIIFRKQGTPTAQTLDDNFPELKVVEELAMPWTVKFESDMIHRGPSKPVIFESLQDWSKSEDPQIRYYSGTAVYTTKFPFNGGKYRQLYLDFGSVTAMAKVKVNGKYVGGLWTPPYRVDVTNLLKSGNNTVEVEVVNTWRNRIIGDLQLPESERIVKARYGGWTAELALQEAGLLGPVKILGVE
ncbi:MAG: glycoside hydrolase family 2, partial [Bacteroidales bacterium]|nr:glycoside hydrolase family 2 [Bacteroidales bacterium]